MHARNKPFSVAAARSVRPADVAAGKSRCSFSSDLIIRVGPARAALVRHTEQSVIAGEMAMRVSHDSFSHAEPPTAFARWLRPIDYGVMTSCPEGVFPMPQESARPTHSWEDIAQEIMRETDPDKLRMLLAKLNDAMLTEARERVRQRFKLMRSA